MLKDKLIYYPRRAQIKIGAVDGSNYFYCGTVGDFLDHMTEYSAQTLADLKEFAAKQRDIHAELCGRVPDIPARLRAMTLGEIIDEIVRTETDADFRGSNRAALAFFSTVSRWLRQIGDARVKRKRPRREPNRSCRSASAKWTPSFSRPMRQSRTKRLFSKSKAANSASTGRWTRRLARVRSLCARPLVAATMTDVLMTNEEKRHEIPKKIHFRR